MLPAGHTGPPVTLGAPAMTYVLNRLLSVILTLFLITLVTFAVTNILPGDVAMMIMGTQSNPEALAGLRESLGLNDPLAGAIRPLGRGPAHRRLGQFADLQETDRRTAGAKGRGVRQSSW